MSIGYNLSVCGNLLLLLLPLHEHAHSNADEEDEEKHTNDNAYNRANSNLLDRLPRRSAIGSCGNYNGASSDGRQPCARRTTEAVRCCLADSEYCIRRSTVTTKVLDAI